MDTRMTRLMRDPQQWKPEKEGDLVAGTVVGIDEREAGYGPFPVFALEADDGTEWEVAGVGTVLHNRLLSLDIRHGDWLGVRYAGKKKSANGSEYKDFRIVHEPAPRPVNVTHAGDEEQNDHVHFLMTSHAKARLLDACQGDKELAKELWGTRVSITEAELIELEAACAESRQADEEPMYAPDEEPF